MDKIELNSIRVGTRVLYGEHFIYRLVGRLYFRTGKFNGDVITTYGFDGSIWNRILWRFYWRIK